MIYLGIDPGTHRIGYGVVRVEGSRIIALDHGVIENIGDDRARHIIHVERSLTDIIGRWSPVAVGIERLFFSTNRKTAMAVSEMRGIILASLTRSSLPIHEFTPQEIKQSVCGYGKAEKRQVQEMVRVILGMQEVVRPDDAADALAIAICCSAVQRTS